MFEEQKNEAYFTETQNILVNNPVDSRDSMSQKRSAKKDDKQKWRITRQYQSHFSCQEAVERLIKVHIDGRGSYDRR